MQAAENAGLVVFGWIEVRDDHIIGIDKSNVAGRAAWSLAFTLTGELATIGAVDAEDMTRADQLEKVLGDALTHTCRS